MFTIALAVGAAALAVWVEVRAPSFAPAAFVWVIANLVAAVVSLHLGSALLQAAGGPGLRLTALFTLVLPALVYVFLSVIWVLRVMQSALNGSVR